MAPSASTATDSDTTAASQPPKPGCLRRRSSLAARFSSLAANFSSLAASFSSLAARLSCAAATRAAAASASRRLSSSRRVIPCPASSRRSSASPRFSLSPRAMASTLSAPDELSYSFFMFYSPKNILQHSLFFMSFFRCPCRRACADRTSVCRITSRPSAFSLRSFVALLLRMTGKRASTPLPSASPPPSPAGEGKERRNARAPQHALSAPARSAARGKNKLSIAQKILKKQKSHFLLFPLSARSCPQER